MYRRPFISPLLKRPRQVNEDDNGDASLEKRARLGTAKTFIPPIINRTNSNASDGGTRTPLLNLQVPNYYSPAAGPAPGPEAYFNALWRNQTMKKNKTWDGDGVLVLEDRVLTLRDIEGKKMGTKPWITGTLAVGDMIVMGSKDVEIDSILSKEDYLSGKPFIKTSKRQSTSSSTTSTTFIPPAVIQTIPQFRTGLRKPNFNGPRHDPTAPDAIVLQAPKCQPDTTPVDVVLDPLIAKHLRPHQKDGVRFLYECVMGIKDFNGQGAILADEMGLGKTLTVIALIWTLLKQSPFPGESSVIKKALIVCPVTLINYWKSEFRKWLGKERIGILIIDQNTDLRTFSVARTYQILLTNYEKLPKLLPQLPRTCFDLVICDEGHRLKTQGNKAAKAMDSLSAKRRILLTGTPIQNDLGELWTMVDFVNPGLLDTYAVFKKTFEQPIVRARQPGATKKVVELGRGRSEALSAMTKMFVLRRTSEILTTYLPSKCGPPSCHLSCGTLRLMVDEYVVFCTPTTLQRRVYKELLESQGLLNCLYHGDINAHLKAITIMRKICNAMTLIKSKAHSIPDDPLYSAIKDLLPSGVILPSQDSGKLSVLKNLLVELHRITVEKVVLVSNFTKTLDVLQTLLQIPQNVKSLSTNSIPAIQKPAVPPLPQRTYALSNVTVAFLLSSKSGGCGLNLVGASRLILYDVDWNPSNDLQSMARIHRDGQKRPVYIYRFLTYPHGFHLMTDGRTGMMDEKIYQRQITKQSLADSFIVDGKGSFGNSFTIEELKNLFSYCETTCDTHNLLDCPCEDNGHLVDPNLLHDHLSAEDEEEDGFIPAAQLKPDHFKKKHKFDALHEFWHFDPRKWKERDDDDEFLCDVIEDSILRSVIERDLSEHKADGSISYLFGVKKG